MTPLGIKTLFDTIHRKGCRSGVNSLLVGLSNSLELTHVYGQPMYIQVELTTHCNAKCPMCARTIFYEGKDSKKPKNMSFQNFKKIILKLPYCESIELQGLGEPLFNPDLIKMIRLCKERNIFSRFTTNSTLLSNWMGKRIITSGLDCIEFSVDSPNAKKFEKIRKGTNFYTVLMNIKRFINLKHEMNSSKPIVRAKVVVSEENISEIPQLLRLLKSVGIRNVLLRELMGDGLRKVPKNRLSLLLNYRDYGKSLGLNVQLAFPDLPPLSNRKKIKCWKIWKAMYITVDGWVTPCCFFPSEKTLNYGNILKQDVKDIWNNEKYKISRKRLRNSLPDYPCKLCVWTN
ncbi:MAG: radical SAM protein [Nanoarchaeota archaeon]|nr:radical SAM protein [Nanoarchaeota archaeon]